MARAPKPVALQSSKMSKEEKEIRQEAEDKLRGDDSKVYAAPPGLNKNIAAIYELIVQELKHAKVLNNLDIDLIVTTADSIWRMKQARRNLDRTGEVIMDHNGRFVKSPWVQVTKDYHAIFHAGVRELGLSPSSRAKLALYQIESGNIEASEEDQVFDNL